MCAHTHRTLNTRVFLRYSIRKQRNRNSSKKRLIYSQCTPLYISRPRPEATAPQLVPVSAGAQLRVGHLVTADGAAVVSDADLFQQSQAPVPKTHQRGGASDSNASIRTQNINRPFGHSRPTISNEHRASALQ